MVGGISMHTPRLAVVLVSWNSAEEMLQCLSRLRAQQGQPHHVVVIDNGSTDGTPQHITNQFPEVELVQLGYNTGFARAVNHAIRALLHRTDYILLLNRDTQFDDTFLSRLIHEAEAHPRCGILSPRIYLERPAKHFWNAGGMLAHNGLYVYGEGEPDCGQYDRYQFEIVFGCAMLLRCRMLEQIGLFDEQFFMFYEDVDLCIRANDAHWGVRALTTLTIMHTGGTSTRAQPALRQFYMARSRMLFLRKHLARFYCPWLFVSELRHTVVIFTRLWRMGNLGAIWAYIRGCIIGMTGHGIMLRSEATPQEIPVRG